jgi:hypothetical protein
MAAAPAFTVDSGLAVELAGRIGALPTRWSEATTCDSLTQCDMDPHLALLTVSRITTAGDTAMAIVLIQRHEPSRQGPLSLRGDQYILLRSDGKWKVVGIGVTMRS